MKLTFDQISAAALGAAFVTQEPDGVFFHRLTPAQEDVYRRLRDETMLRKACATAGVVLSFSTDSPRLWLKASFGKAWTRFYASVDVTANGTYIGSADNFSHLPMEGNYASTVCKRGPFEKEFDLGDGEKTVKIYLPWSASVALTELSLSDGSTFAPVRPEKKMLFIGDSITQGYDALRPMNRWPARVADALGVEEVNKSVGGEIFFPELTAELEAMTPAAVFMAWGTNNWGTGVPREKLLADAPVVFSHLRKTYPDVPLYAILPIWRGDREEARPYGAFEQMRADVKGFAEDAGAICIDGYDLVPHDPKFFGDLRLHPNDDGFAHYAEGVLKAVGCACNQGVKMI